MSFHLKFPLADILSGAIRGDLTLSQMNELARLFHALALPLVQRKFRWGKLHKNLLGLNEHDLSHDSIADLFERNENGIFVELSSYFRQADLTACSEEFLVSELRKLVYRKVNDSIFRMYNEADPALGKIIRNLKIALEKSHRFEAVEMLGEQYIVSAGADRLAHLPSMTEDELHHEISVVIMRHENIPDILSTFSDMLTIQESFQRKVRILSLAIAIKHGYELTAPMSTDADDDLLTRLAEQDSERLIRESCKQVESIMRPRYVGKRKVEAALFSNYFLAIEQLIISEVLNGHDGEATYYTSLRKVEPTLTKEEYMKSHRIIFEYMAKLTKKHIREQIKET